MAELRGNMQREKAPADFSRLASDYDRWGLALEAEALRREYRDAVIRELKESALRAIRRAPPRADIA